MANIVLFIVDTIILMVLMRLLAGERYGFISSAIAALLGAFGAAVLTQVFTPVGPNAPLVAGCLVAVGFGLAISLVFNIGLISSIIIGFVYLVVRSGVYYFLAVLMTS